MLPCEAFLGTFNLVETWAAWEGPSEELEKVAGGSRGLPWSPPVCTGCTALSQLLVRPKEVFVDEIITATETARLKERTKQTFYEVM